MITMHYLTLPASIDWHTVVDDFGNQYRPFDLNPHSWANAYRFANGQTFEQAGMRSFGSLVAEH